MKTAVLAAIGDELLGGARTEANCTFLARHLAEAGWSVRRIEVVPDDDPDIISLLERWIGSVDLLVISGGLGPTHDDRTRAAIASCLGCGLREDTETYDRMLELSSGERRMMFERTRDTQAMVPESADAVFNPEGSALGIRFERGGTLVISLPGVPVEYAAMARQELPEVFRSSHVRESVTILGLPEMDVVETIPEIIGDSALHVSVLPSFPTVELILVGETQRVSGSAGVIRERFGERVLPHGCSTLAEAVLSEGRRLGCKVACAESCTGGMLAGAITDVPGSSDVFVGGIVSYSNDVKESVLGVAHDILLKHGAVSAECAEAMARGALRISGADFSVSTTGVAGPDGGTPEKPVGGVWFGLAVKGGDGTVTSGAFHRNLRGWRDDVRRKAVNFALASLWRTMRTGHPAEISHFRPPRQGIN